VRTKEELVIKNSHMSSDYVYFSHGPWK